MNLNFNKLQEVLGDTYPAQSPVMVLPHPEFFPPVSSDTELTAERRKDHKLKCQGHATQGTAARYYPVAAGREEIPQPSEAEREKIFSFVPMTASQVNRLVKYHRFERVQEVTDEQGQVKIITFKPATLDEALLLGLQVEVLKSAKRDDYVDQLLTYFMAPNGLGRADHQRTRALLARLAPRHILDLARNFELQVWQDFMAEAKTAWSDPAEANLTLYKGEIPARPKVKDANICIAGLSERSALLPEPFRLVLKDLIKILSDCQPSKLHDFMEKVQELLTLSSQDLIVALIEWGQQMPEDAGLDFLIHPKEFKAVGGDLHQRLQALMIVPKRKKVAAKKAVGQKPAEMQDAVKKASAKKRTASKAKSKQAPVAPQQAVVTELTPTAAELTPAATELDLGADVTAPVPATAAEVAADSAALIEADAGTELDLGADVTASVPVTASEGAADSAALSEADAGTEPESAPQEAVTATGSNAAPDAPSAQVVSAQLAPETEFRAAVAPVAASEVPAVTAERPVNAALTAEAQATVPYLTDALPNLKYDVEGRPFLDGDPNALCQVAVDLTDVRARERAIAAAKAAAAAELKQRLERQQRESNRKHNKDVRKQRKAARRRK